MNSPLNPDPLRPREEFRPARAFRRTLPAAIFLSLIVTLFLPPSLRASPIFSFGYQKLISFEGMCVVAAFAAMSLLSSPLAIVYAVRTRGHDGLRWMYILFNVLVCFGWVAALAGMSMKPYLRR